MVRRLRRAIMGKDVRFVIMTSDGGLATDLRAKLQTANDVKILAEIEDAALMAQAIEQFPVDVLLVDLDPNPESILPVIGGIAREHRDLVIFTTSSSTEGSLILKVMRTGVREFLPKPVDSNALNEAVDRIRAAQSDETEEGQLVTVVGTSGGVGATLIATNLAVELAALVRGKVAVIDLDYRYGQVATLLDVDPSYTLADLCGSPERLDQQIVEKALTEHSSGVRVLARPAHLAETELITAASCLSVASTLVQFNEFVICDGPTRFDVGGKSILTLADTTLLVVQQLVPCVRTAVRLLENMRENGQSMDRIKLVCNRVGRMSGHLSVNDLTSTLGLEAFASLPDDWETASGGINLGEPLITYSPKSKLRLAIQQIAQSLHGSGGQTDEKGARKQGLIGRIFAGN